MGTVHNIGGIDEGQKGELTVRVVASLMAIVEAKHNDVTAEQAPAYIAMAYKHHLLAAADAINNAEVLDAELVRIQELLRQRGLDS